MKKNAFTLTNGSEISLTINFSILREVDRWDFQGLKMPSLTDISTLESITELFETNSLLVPCVWAIFVENCRAFNISTYMTEADFLSHINGDTIESIRTAFYYAFFDFGGRLTPILERWKALHDEAKRLLEENGPKATNRLLEVLRRNLSGTQAETGDGSEFLTPSAS